MLKEVGVQMEEPIIVKQSTKGTLLFSFGALVLAVLSLFLILVDVRTFANGPRVFQNGTVYVILKIVAVIGVVFFGYAFFYLIKRAKQGKAILVVDEKGVTDNSSSISFGFIPWGDIDEVRVDAVFGNNCIELLLNNENDYIAKLSGLKKQAILANKKMGYPAVCITLNSTGVDPRALLPGIQKKFAAAKAKA